MIYHAMVLIQKQVECLNPGEIPIMTVGQPRFAIAKEIQWLKPDCLGEDKFVVMTGDLHIEMALMNLGDWLEGSGWAALLSLAEITPSGKADSKLSGCSNITLSDIFIKLPLLSYICEYIEYIEECTDQMPLHEEEWELSKEAHPMFKFWHLTLHLELLLLEYVRSIRSGDFHLYVKTILSVISWMFSLDHRHYARWLPVHIRAMLKLPNAQPQIYSSFEDGKFTVQNSNRKFPRMALDQNHEPQNARIKGTAGAIGLTENDTSLSRWLVSGPEVARLLDGFCHEGEDDVTLEHHDSTVAIQSQLLKDLNSLVLTIDDLGHPFTDVALFS